uniref:Uncharacterized protein n=1 Tax=Anguilla anguilla TaxID=7936 RepID=A0A0E9XAU3_ANGAN
MAGKSEGMAEAHKHADRVDWRYCQLGKNRSRNIQKNVIFGEYQNHPSFFATSRISRHMSHMCFDNSISTNLIDLQ